MVLFIEQITADIQLSFFISHCHLYFLRTFVFVIRLCVMLHPPMNICSIFFLILLRKNCLPKCHHQNLVMGDSLSLLPFRQFHAEIFFLSLLLESCFWLSNDKEEVSDTKTFFLSSSIFTEICFLLSYKQLFFFQLELFLRRYMLLVF